MEHHTLEHGAKSSSVGADIDSFLGSSPHVDNGTVSRVGVIERGIKSAVERFDKTDTMMWDTIRRLGLTDEMVGRVDPVGWSEADAIAVLEAFSAGARGVATQAETGATAPSLIPRTIPEALEALGSSHGSDVTDTAATSEGNESSDVVGFDARRAVAALLERALLTQPQGTAGRDTDATRVGVA